MSDFDDVSFDEDDFPTDFITKKDDLEDSILGELLKGSSKQLRGKNTAVKHIDIPTSSTKHFSINSKEDVTPSISIDQVKLSLILMKATCRSVMGIETSPKLTFIISAAIVL